MLGQGLILLQLREGVEVLGECHLITEPVDALMTPSAHHDAFVEFSATVASAKKRATVHLAGNQVVKR